MNAAARLLVLTACLLGSACATNPVTGEILLTDHGISHHCCNLEREAD